MKLSQENLLLTAVLAYYADPENVSPEEIALFAGLQPSDLTLVKKQDRYRGEGEVIVKGPGFVNFSVNYTKGHLGIGDVGFLPINEGSLLTTFDDPSLVGVEGVYEFTAAAFERYDDSARYFKIFIIPGPTESRAEAATRVLQTCFEYQLAQEGVLDFDRGEGPGLLVNELVFSGRLGWVLNTPSNLFVPEFDELDELVFGVTEEGGL